MKKIIAYGRSHRTAISLGLFLVTLASSLLLFPAAESESRWGLILGLGLVVGGNLLSLFL